MKIGNQVVKKLQMNYLAFVYKDLVMKKASKVFVGIITITAIREEIWTADFDDELEIKSFLF